MCQQITVDLSIHTSNNIVMSKICEFAELIVFVSSDVRLNVGEVGRNFLHILKYSLSVRKER